MSKRTGSVLFSLVSSSQWYSGIGPEVMRIDVSSGHQEALFHSYALAWVRREVVESSSLEILKSMDMVPDNQLQLP